MKISEDYAMLQQDLATDVTNMMLTGFASSRLAAAIETITTADGLIATTPIFTTRR